MKRYIFRRIKVFTNSLDKIANLEETEIEINLNEEEIDFILKQLKDLLRFHPKIFGFLEKFFKCFPELNEKQIDLINKSLLFFLFQDLNN